MSGLSSVPTPRRRFAFAILVSGLLILSAPLVAEAQRWLRGLLGAGYIPVINALVGTAAAGALVLAIVRIRDRVTPRFSLLIAAVIMAAVYAWHSGLASAESNAVERFHFVEYGIVTFLFYRVVVPGQLAKESDLSVLLLPVLCALIVGTADEWLQHLAPGRIGELRDIAMNLAAISCGMLVSIAVAPPRRIAVRMRQARRQLLTAGAVAIAAVGAFVHAVHSGTLIQDDEVAFLSRYDAEALARRAASARLPDRIWGLIEDQYATEAAWHVQARNERWAMGDAAGAWGEQRILEKYRLRAPEGLQEKAYCPRESLPPLCG